MSKQRICTGKLGTAGKTGKYWEQRSGTVDSSPTLLPRSTSSRVASFTARKISSRSSSPYFPLQPAFSQPSFPRLSHAFAHISPSRALPGLSPLRPNSPAKALQRPLLRPITCGKSITAPLQNSVSAGKLGKTAQRSREKVQERPVGPSFTRLLQCEGHQGAVTDFTFLQNSLVTGSTDYSFSGWTLPDLSPSPYHTIYPYPGRIQPIYTVRAAHKGPIWAVQSFAGNKVVTSGGDCRVKVWSGVDILRIFAPKVLIRALLTPNYSQNGVLIGAGGEGTILAWDVETGKCLFQRRIGHHGAIRCLISIGTETYASGGEDRSITLWDVRTHSPVAALPGHTDNRNLGCANEKKAGDRGSRRASERSAGLGRPSALCRPLTHSLRSRLSQCTAAGGRRTAQSQGLRPHIHEFQKLPSQRLVSLPSLAFSWLNNVYHVDSCSLSSHFVQAVFRSSAQSLGYQDYQRG